MSEEQKDLYLVVEDGTGRQLIGEFVEKNAMTVTLRNPLLIVEHVMSPQPGQDQQQIMLNVSPIMHTFVIDTWEFKWAGMHGVTDEKLISTYEKFHTQMRASRSGIETPTAAQSNAIQLAR